MPARSIVGWASIVALFVPSAAMADFVDISDGDIGDANVTVACAWGDFDGDGDDDLYLVNDGAPNRLLRNDGFALLVDVTAPPLDVTATASAASWHDVDEDGDLDLYLSRPDGANTFLRNDAGSFVAVASGALDDPSQSTSISWIDFDADGDLDLYVGSFDGPNKLFRNDGGGTYALTSTDPLGQGATRAAAWGDHDNDGDLDVYLAQSGANKLLENREGGLFADITTPTLQDMGEGSTAAWGDADQDGDLDLFVANQTEADRLLRNDGADFSPVTVTALGADFNSTDVTWVDVDLDGDRDLYVVHRSQPNLLLRNDGGAFAAITTGPGAAISSFAAAWNDVDRDGDQDLYLANAAEPDVLLRNDHPVDAGWLRVRARPTFSNPSAIGARLRAVIGGQERIFELGSDSGHRSQNERVFTVGTGSATVVDTLELRWPSLTVSRAIDVPVGQMFELSEPAPAWLDVAVDAARDPGSSAGVAWGDYDDDGDLDLYVPRRGQPNLLLRNASGEGFLDAAIGLLEDGGIGRGAAWGDADNDGDLDLYLANTGANRLYTNTGGGAFADGTSPALADAGAGRSVAWVDFDQDGDLDLYLCNLGSANRLYRNDGGGFTDVATGTLADTTSTIGSAWADFDADGDVDLYLVDESNPNVLLRNSGGTFTPVTEPLLAGGSLARAAHWADFDEDGRLDLYLTDLAGGNRLLRNGVSGFSDVTPPAVGDDFQTAATVIGDFDLDGHLDLYHARNFAGDRLFLGDGGGGFSDATSGSLKRAGLQSVAAAGDYDGDGDLDLYAAFLDQPNRLLRNDRTNDNHWLRVALDGAFSSRQGTGAQVRLTTGDAIQVRTVTAGGNGLFGQDGVPASFGLGAATQADTLAVVWPSGIIQTRTDVAGDQVVRLDERTGLTRLVDVQPLEGVAGSDIEASIDVRVVGADAVRVLARVGGTASAFDERTATLVDGDTFQPRATFTLPTSLVSRRGVEWYVEVEKGAIRATFPAGAPLDRLFAATTFGEQTMPEVAGPSRYVMFGVPFEPLRADWLASIEEQLGDRDPFAWRLGRWEPARSTYAAFPELPDLAPGRGYWLIQAEPVALSAAGRSPNTVTGVDIVLEPGWNQIAHAFPFPVAWSDVDLNGAPDVEPRIIALEVLGYVVSEVLEPWRGYWIRNNGAASQTIRIPGNEMTSARPAVRPTPATRFELRATLEQGALRAGPVRAGVHAAAAEGLDRHDFHEPPSLPGRPAIAFVLDQNGAAHRLDADMRGAVAGGAIWRLSARAAGGVRDRARVRITGMATLPEGIDAWLVDGEGFGARPLRASSTFDLLPGAHRSDWLVVGTVAYLERVRHGLAPAATAPMLLPNSPNPFNPSTSLRFALPRSTRVVLKIYNARGRLVHTVADGVRFESGRHAIDWHGVDQAGRPLASGVYYYRIEADGLVASRPMLLLK